MALWACPGTAAQRVPGLAMLAFCSLPGVLFLKSIQDNCCGHRTFFLTVAFIVIVPYIGAGQPDAD